MTQNVLVVGAGLSGATVARCLADAGIDVTVIDRRDHIAGNAFDTVDEPTGLRVHAYGPHIFHTNNRRVVDFLSRFTGWVPYEHRVMALLGDGRFVPMPPNDHTIAVVGADRLIDVLYRPYSRTMWGRELEALDTSILERVPIRPGTDARYFTDSFQAMPADGYTAMVCNMLRHERIDVRLGVAYEPSFAGGFDHVFSTASIDEFYGFVFGTLPYRTIEFVNRYVGSVPYRHATTNFTDGGEFTRYTDWRLFPNNPGGTPHRADGLLTFERPKAFMDGTERYYPIKDSARANRALYESYSALADDRTTHLGRCGSYAYLDMHQAVNQAMTVVAGFISRSSDGFRP